MSPCVNQGFVSDESFWNALSWVNSTIACVGGHIDTLGSNPVPVSGLRKWLDDVTDSIVQSCKPSTLGDVKAVMDAAFASFEPLSDTMVSPYRFTVDCR
jgi:hypothetical protein